MHGIIAGNTHDGGVVLPGSGLRMVSVGVLVSGVAAPPVGLCQLAAPPSEQRQSLLLD